MPGQADSAPANQRPSSTQFASTSNVQVSFGGGVNPMAPSHLLKDDEVQTATNIDFSLMNGALVPRRGCFLGTKLSSSSISKIFVNYNDNATIVGGFIYAMDAPGVLYRGTQPLGTGFSAIATLGTIGALGQPAFGAAMQYTFVSNGTSHYKDDGTNITEWIKQVPDAPVIAVNTLTPVTMTGTYTAINGSITGTTSDTATFVGDTNGNAVVAFVFTTSSDLSVNGTFAIGNYGVHFLDVAFSDPQQVQSISLDYSIGGTDFSNFWHVELDPSVGGVYIGSNAIQQLLDANPLGSNTSADARAAVYSQLAQNNFNPLSFAPSVANSITPWGNTVPQFSFVGNQAPSTNLWSDIQALRIGCVSNVLNGTTTVTNTITAGHAQIWGAQEFPLTDVINGYYYWQSYATLDTAGNKIDEGASSTPSGPYQMQNANVTVTNTATATGSLHGVNAIITYRQGGFMAQPYAIYTYTGTGTTSSVIGLATITDTTPDLDALTNNFVMPPPLMPPFAFPGDVSSISQLYKDRLFVADGNVIRWSLPGQFGSFPILSFQEVGRIGDAISGFQLWNPGMVIVNRSSVYELVGNDFETGDFTLSRTGCRRGSMAPNTIISTPYGIPLLNADGLFMYIPGYNQEQEIGWFNAKYMDMFRGGDPDSPAVYKGNRIPAINLGSIQLSCAGFRNHQLYLGVNCGPTSNNAAPNTLVVIDFQLKQAWWYTYPFSFTSIYVDDRSTFFYLGSDDGSMMVVETSVGDQTTGGVVVPMVWSARTRQWTANTDSVVENISVDSEGPSISVSAYYDNFYNPVVGTLTNQVRQYTTPPLGGTFVNAVAFDFIGTYTPVSTASSTLNAVYSMDFDILREPVKVQYWRTEYDEHGYTADKLWDVLYCDIDIPGTCTVSAVTFVDNTAVMTNTITGTGGGRYVYEFAFPAEIYGRVAYTTYTT